MFFLVDEVNQDGDEGMMAAPSVGVLYVAVKIENRDTGTVKPSRHKLQGD